MSGRIRPKLGQFRPKVGQKSAKSRPKVGQNRPIQCMLCRSSVECQVVVFPQFSWCRQHLMKNLKLASGGIKLAKNLKNGSFGRLCAQIRMQDEKWGMKADNKNPHPLPLSRMARGESRHCPSPGGCPPGVRAGRGRNRTRRQTSAERPPESTR